MKNIEILLKKKKKKSDNMFMIKKNFSHNEKIKLVQYKKICQRMRKKCLIIIYKEKYKKRFSFPLMFEKLSLNKYKKFLILRLQKFTFENAFFEKVIFLKKILKHIF